MRISITDQIKKVKNCFRLILSEMLIGLGCCCTFTIESSIDNLVHERYLFWDILLGRGNFEQEAIRDEFYSVISGIYSELCL